MLCTAFVVVVVRSICVSFSPFFSTLVSPLSSLAHFAEIVVMDSLHAYSPSASFFSCDSSLYSVIEYVPQYGHCLDAYQFGTMRIVGDQPCIYDRRFDKYRYITAGAWMNH